jgi:putative ABC transport system permease protein
MAMTLALVANSGLNTMIGSFRQATDDWLNQRLAAELYLRAEPGRGAPEVAELEAWLTERAPAVRLALRHAVTLEQEAPTGGRRTVELIDLADAEPFRSSVDLLRAVPDAEREFRAGRGVYVSERAWRLDGWDLGDRVTPCPAADSLPVLGIYHDYGNPRSQWMVSQSLFQACWPGRAPAGIGLYGPDETDWAQVRAGLGNDLGLGDDALIDQRELRAVGLAVFDRTFGVTRALNLLTLLVAGIGIFCAVSAIHHHRVGQQALLASLGLPRLQRGALLLSQWGLLGLLCMVLVWPFGTALAWYLAAVVTPAAFGWSFALRLEAGHYGVLALLAALALVLAVALPSLRLLRVSPAALLREQTL